MLFLAVQARAWEPNPLGGKRKQRLWPSDHLHLQEVTTTLHSTAQHSGAQLSGKAEHNTTQHRTTHHSAGHQDDARHPKHDTPRHGMAASYAIPSGLTG